MSVRRILRRANGQLLVFVAVALVLLGLFIGLAIDLGRAYLLRSQLSGMVDAAALAAAKVLKGQSAFQDEAAKAACDSMLMNGMNVQFDSGNNTCASAGSNGFTLSVDFVDKVVGGGPPVKFVQVTGQAPLNLTFMRLAKFITGNDLSTIPVSAFAEGGPERPVDLMLVLDRSGSMGQKDGTGTKKIDALKCALTGLGCVGDGFLDQGFSAIDQLGMTAFGRRGCGEGGNDEFEGDECVPDEPLGSAINDIKDAIDALGLSGTTNTMEGLRTAKNAISASVSDPARATSRKVVLLVTDGQPTALRRDSIAECEETPLTGISLTGPPWDGDDWTESAGCYFVKRGGSKSIDESDGMRRWKLNNSSPDNFEDSAPGIGHDLYLETMAAVRNASRDEAHQIRELGGGNVVIFAIGIGEPTNPDATAKFDANARCLLAQIANDKALIESLSTSKQDGSCAAVYKTDDGDPHDGLKISTPAGTPPTFNPSQQEGKVYEVDLNGDVQAQLQLIFNQIAALLKLRLTI